MKKKMQRLALLVCSVLLFSFAPKSKSTTNGDPTETQRFWGWQTECGVIYYEASSSTCKRWCQRVHYIFWIADSWEDPYQMTVSCPPNIIPIQY